MDKTTQQLLIDLFPALLQQLTAAQQALEAGDYETYYSNTAAACGKLDALHKWNVNNLRTHVQPRYVDANEEMQNRKDNG